jgi:Zn-dependent M28 family amino/carboxypeptidase
MQPERKVRVGFWTGEEIGLYGSFRYLSTLAFEERRAIDLYLNFDMLGSPNGGRIVYDDELAATGSAGITAQFVAALEADGLAYLREDLGGGSDHFPFQQGGVPTGGLFSGASEPKDEEAAALFGGEVGAPYDACYHLTCDRVDGVNRQLLEEMLRTAAYVTGVYASASATARP